MGRSTAHYRKHRKLAMQGNKRSQEICNHKAAVDGEIHNRRSRQLKDNESARKRRKAKGSIKGKHYDHKQKRLIGAIANMGQKEKSRLKGSKRA